MIDHKTLPQAPATAADIAKMVAAGKATGLPGIEQSIFFNLPALKVHGKWLICARQQGVYVMLCPMVEKEVLIESAPDVFFDTNHHKNSAAVLAWVDKMNATELRDRIVRAWHIQAPKKLRDAHGGKIKEKPKPKPSRRRK